MESFYIVNGIFLYCLSCLIILKIDYLNRDKRFEIEIFLIKITI